MDAASIEDRKSVLAGPRARLERLKKLVTAQLDDEDDGYQTDAEVC